MKKNIALVAGGYSSEHVVSLYSADLVENTLDRSRYNVYRIVIDQNDWFFQQEEGSKIAVNRADFSINLNGQKVTFDCALIVIHGTPGEDGLLQAYFDLLNIPYTTCDVLVSALTFNKWACKKYLADANISMPKGVLIQQANKLNVNGIIEQLGLPIFVKPNEGGSSFGVTKVQSGNDMQNALDSAFAEETAAVIAEEFIAGVELTNGVMKRGEEVLAFPVTEIVSKKDFFDYEAKYTPGMSDEITPARISDKLTKRVQETSTHIYKYLGCKGIVRMDYIYNEEADILYFLEVNTVPGMTKNSLVPKQVEAMGENLSDIFNDLINNSIPLQ